MKILLLMLVLGTAAIAFAANAAHNRVGTWQLDVAASDFGKGPAPTSMTMTILEDTLEKIGFRLKRTNRDGSQFSYEWHGPKDGSPQLIQSPELPNAKAVSGVKEIRGILIEHGIDPDGSLEFSRISTSPDGQAMQVDATWIEFDGTRATQKWIWRRVK